ncbi:DUF4387 domain-containing protein [Treponema sp.]
MKIKLIDFARVIRSKNSGPFELTLDVLFKDRETYELFRDRKLFDEALIAQLYGLPLSDVLGVVWFDPANAVKATLRRLIASGSPGDSDIYGAQQHGPLLDLEWDI